MAAFSTSHYFLALTFIILFLKAVASNPNSLFSFTDFEKDLVFKSNVALYGHAKVVDGGSAVLLSGSGSLGAGRVVYRKPIKLVEGKPRQLLSFSTYFTFSIPSDSGDGLAFVMVPNVFEGDDNFDNGSSGFSFGLKNRKFRVVGVEFSASRDGGNGGSTSCNVAINVGDSVPAKTSNTSSISLALESGEKLHAWIDYEASSRRLEVRLSQYGNSRPSDPFLWHSIDLSNVWEAKEVFVGFSPVKENTSQACFLYSWSFVLRHFPHWMHSEPLDPKVLLAKNTETPIKPRSDCFLRVLAAMIFGSGCGALTAFILLYLWTIFGNRRPVMPEEYVMQPIDYEYRKVNVVVDKAIKDGKN